MKQKLTPRWLVIKLAGILFAAYSAYNIFILYRNGSTLPEQGVFITALVAALFGLLAVFAWTSEIKNVRFQVIRTTVFIVDLLIVFALKLRMIGRSVAYIDSAKPHTVLYGATYFMTLAGMLVLFIYYAFILKNLPLYPRMSVILPAAAIILFLGTLILEAVLFFAFGFAMESSPLRTMVIRPVFSLGFVGLSAYFLFPPQITAEDENIAKVDDTDFIV